MSGATEETRQTAFRAAFLIGADGRRLFTWIAAGSDEAARRSAVLSLYLHWRRDPAYVNALLVDLVNRVSLPPLWRSGRVLRFLADLSITIYINHPERDDVVRNTSRLWRAVFTRRLRLNQLLFLIRGPLGHQAAKAFSGRTLSTALLTELQPPTRFFDQTDEQRARFLRTVPLVDPAERFDGQGRVDDLVALFDSEILLHRILAALVLVIHAADEPERAGALVDELEGRLGDHGAFWTLLAFAVPLPTTPSAWIPRLEAMTVRLVEQRRGLLFEPDSILERFDIALLPLGLAYGKERLEMPVIARLLADSLAHDRALGLRLVRSLAAVGFYYPEAVFATLRRQPDLLHDEDARPAVAQTLATIRTLHFDRVDLFLSEMRAPDALRVEIGRQPPPSLVARCINWIGFYNNAVHQALYAPAMRRTLLIGGLTALGEARKPSDFIGPYTDAAIDLAERAKFELIRWTEPDFDVAGRDRDAGASA